MIEIDMDKCSGCRQCEVICSFSHFEGNVQRKSSRIKVAKVEEEGLDYPVFCLQCSERYCVEECPVDALSIGELGHVSVDENLCIGCGNCAEACPIGAITIIDDVPLVCDLCGGDPLCVETCSLDALSFIQEKSGEVSLADMKKDSTDVSIEEKRVEFCRELGEDMRKRWKHRQ